MFKRILAPLDGSDTAEKSLPYAESLARQYDAEIIFGWVILLRTYAVSDFEPINYGLATLMDTSGEREHATSYLQRLQSRFQQRQLRASYRIIESHSIADAIVTMAHEVKADLIVKTTYARLGPSRWLQGNVAATVLQRAACPVFLVRVPGDDTEDERAASVSKPVENSTVS